MSKARKGKTAAMHIDPPEDCAYKHYRKLIGKKPSLFSFGRSVINIWPLSIRLTFDPSI